MRILFLLILVFAPLAVNAQKNKEKFEYKVFCSAEDFASGRNCVEGIAKLQFVPGSHMLKIRRPDDSLLEIPDYRIWGYSDKQGKLWRVTYTAVYEVLAADGFCLYGIEVPVERGEGGTSQGVQIDYYYSIGLDETPKSLTRLNLVSDFGKWNPDFLDMLGAATSNFRFLELKNKETGDYVIMECFRAKGKK